MSKKKLPASSLYPYFSWRVTIVRTISFIRAVFGLSFEKLLGTFELKLNP
jgi:hypothetical protein